MDNYKFTSLLAQTSLSTAEKYNLTVIFNTLTDNRKIEIIDNWRVYYDKILSIHTAAEEEKAAAMVEAWEAGELSAEEAAAANIALAESEAAS